MNQTLDFFSKLKEAFFRIRYNRYFEWVVVGVIILSAILIGVKTFENTREYLLLKTLDLAITIFFLLEVIIKLSTEKNWQDYFKSGWNVFDFTIVVLSLIPFGSSENVILGRILRIFRVLRIITIIPELKLLIESLIRALPSIGYISILLFIIFYIFAAIGSFLFVDINPELWGNIFLSLLTLFRIMTFEDWTDVMYETLAVYSWSWIFYVLFIFLTVFTFLNLFIGTVLSSIEEERDKKKNSKREEQFKVLEDKIDSLEEKLDLILKKK